MSYYNTNPVASSATSGTIMLGFCDPWDDIANGSAASGESCAIIDNVKVVQLSTPVIITGPTTAHVNLGGSATFSVVASTVTGVTNYQWYNNGVAIANATNASLTLNPTVAANYSSAFSVLVDDGTYSTWSSTATVVATTPPSISTPPSNLAAVIGGSPTFSVTASTSSGVTNYQWTYYGTNLSGATAQTLTLANVQAVSFGGPYNVVVNDGTTSVTSSPAATLTLAVSPTITSPVRAGTNFQLSFNTEVGPAYVVDFKTNLTDAVWSHLQTNNGTGGIIPVTTPATGTHRFFRVRLQ
jgi:hypothetical protein